MSLSTVFICSLTNADDAVCHVPTAVVEWDWLLSGIGLIYYYLFLKNCAVDFPRQLP